MSRADEALPQEIRNTGAFDLSVRLARCPADGRAVVAKAFADADAALPARIRQPRDRAGRSRPTAAEEMPRSRFTTERRSGRRHRAVPHLQAALASRPGGGKEKSRHSRRFRETGISPVTTISTCGRARICWSWRRRTGCSTWRTPIWDARPPSARSAPSGRCPTGLLSPSARRSTATRRIFARSPSSSC